jgi:hypothetical protein
MVAIKRINRDGLVISGLCHLGILAVVLLIARGAGSSEQVIPPDAMQVRIVTPKDMPRYSGTPSMRRTSGGEQEGQSQPQTAKSEQPPAAPRQPQPNDQHQAQRDAPPQAKEPPLPQADTGKLAMAQPADPPAPSAADAPDTAANAAYLALAGGKLGGGFMAPPVNSPLVGYDFTVPFRELLSTCGALPSGFTRDQKISIVVRVFLKRDGTVEAAPQLLEPNPSAEQQELLQSFASGLQKCQPYTMLPPDRYSQWKTLDLVVHPHNYAAGTEGPH